MCDTSNHEARVNIAWPVFTAVWNGWNHNHHALGWVTKNYDEQTNFRCDSNRYS